MASDYPSTTELAVSDSIFAVKRRQFHAALIERGLLILSPTSVPSNADKDNKASVRYASGVARRLNVETVADRMSAQASGSAFERACAEFLQSTMGDLTRIRPGSWTVRQMGGRGQSAQAAMFEQYAHLADLDVAVKAAPELQSALGNAYSIAPDVVVYRAPLSDAEINAESDLVDTTVATRSALRGRYQTRSLLHAVISCKWTIRSDRSQNSRSEAINLIRNRKGRTPHIAVLTAEPLPSRLASLALGTGDLDCVYHFALPELIATIEQSGEEESLALLMMMVEGRRLKDVSDLPLDLAV